MGWALITGSLCVIHKYCPNLNHCTRGRGVELYILPTTLTLLCPQNYIDIVFESIFKAIFPW